jgi:hypothetical protein
MFNNSTPEYCPRRVLAYVGPDLLTCTSAVRSAVALAYKLKTTDFYKQRSGLAALVRGQRRAVPETLRLQGRSFNKPIVRQPTRADLNAPCPECGDIMHLKMVTSVSGEPNMIEHIFVCTGCNAVDVFAFQKMTTN